MKLLWFRWMRKVADQSRLQFMVILEGSLDDYRSNPDRLVEPSSFANIRELRTEQLSDRADHVRLLADNTFGFEDMRGGGDQDFDDIVIRATFV